MAFPEFVDIEDTAQLLAYLRDSGHITPDETPKCVILEGGVSNRTVRVQRQQSPDWILKQALEKLRVKVDWFSAPERIHHEAAGLRQLAQVIPVHVPVFVFEDETFHILAMSAIPQPHQNWKTQLLNATPDINHAKQFGQLLAHIHNTIQHYPDIETRFADTRFFEELRIEPYYAYTASQLSQAKSFLEQLIHETRQRRQTLVHGDYSPKNVLLYENRLYILDYEVIHFGDPAFDVGFSMTHFLSKAHYRKTHRQTFIHMATTYWHAYRDAVSEPLLAQSLEQYAVRHTLACMLARVAGRSPLEYLDATHRENQKKFVLDLMQMKLQTMPDLITSINERLKTIHADH